MWLTAAFFSAFTFGIGGFLMKVGAERKYTTADLMLGLYTCGSLLFLSTLLYTHHFYINLHVISFALLVGLGSFYGNVFVYKAYQTGPASLTSPLVNFNIVLVVMMSVIVYHEALTWIQYLCIFSILLGVSILTSSAKKTAVTINFKLWFFYIALAILLIFLREGGLKIAQENQQNNLDVLFFGYSLGVLLALGHNIKTFKLKSLTLHIKGTSLGLVIGIFSAIGMGLLTYALTQGPASVVVPIFSTRSFVVVVLAVLIYREKLNILQQLSVGLIIIGLAFIG